MRRPDFRYIKATQFPHCRAPRLSLHCSFTRGCFHLQPSTFFLPLLIASLSFHTEPLHIQHVFRFYRRVFVAPSCALIIAALLRLLFRIRLFSSPRPLAAWLMTVCLLCTNYSLLTFLHLCLFLFLLSSALPRPF